MRDMEGIKGGGMCCEFVKREVELSGGTQPCVTHPHIYTNTLEHCVWVDTQGIQMGEVVYFSNNVQKVPVFVYMGRHTGLCKLFILKAVAPPSGHYGIPPPVWVCVFV